MKRRAPSVVFGLVTLTWLAVGCGALAQEPGIAPELEGRTIREIAWQGLSGLSEDDAAHYLGLSAGEALDLEVLNRGVHALWETGLFEDLRAEATAEGEGVRLVVTVAERPRLRSIRIEGVAWAVREEIERRFAALFPEEGDTVPLARGELETLRAAIEEAVRRDGQSRATVGYELVDEAPGEVSALFGVLPESRLRIREIRFVGNEALSDRRLRRAMRRNRPAGLSSRLAGRGSWDPEGLAADLRAIGDLYRRRGFKDVVVHEPAVEIGSRGVKLEIEVREGARWKLGGLSIDGNRRFSDQRLISLFERPREAWLDLTAVAAWLDSVHALYRRDGRVETRIERDLRERPDGTVDVFARIEESEQLRVGRLEIEGNTRTREKVVRRELGVREGEVLDLERLRASLSRIEGRGLFAFPGDPVQVRRTGAGTAEVVVRGEELPRFRTRFGGGWSEEDGASAHAAVETANFLGRGHAAGLLLVSGEVRDEFELFYNVPWFLERPQALGGELFGRSFGYLLPADQRFTREETGASAVWSRSLERRQGLRLSYTNARLEDLQLRRDADGAEVRRDLELRHSAVELRWSHDSRDRPLDPRRGLQAAVSLEAAGGALGGDSRFYRAESSLALYRPLGRSPAGRFALRLRGGRIEPRGGEPLSPLETWFLGGNLGPRGFASRSLTARDEADRLLLDELGFVVGGTRYLSAALEVDVAVAGPVSLALFADAANVYADGQSFDPGRLRTTAGAELRIRLPKVGLPIRLIWSENLDPLPGDRFDTFQFRFGGGF